MLREELSRSHMELQQLRDEMRSREDEDKTRVQDLSNQIRERDAQIFALQGEVAEKDKLLEQLRVAFREAQSFVEETVSRMVDPATIDRLEARVNVLNNLVHIGNDGSLPPDGADIEQQEMGSDSDEEDVASDGAALYADSASHAEAAGHVPSPVVDTQRVSSDFLSSRVSNVSPASGQVTWPSAPASSGSVLPRALSSPQQGRKQNDGGGLADLFDFGAPNVRFSRSRSQSPQRRRVNPRGKPKPPGRHRLRNDKTTSARRGTWFGAYPKAS